MRNWFLKQMHTQRAQACRLKCMLWWYGGSKDHFYREKHEANELQLSLQSVTFSLQFLINPVVGNTVLLIERSLLKPASTVWLQQEILSAVITIKFPLSLKFLKENIRQVQGWNERTWVIAVPQVLSDIEIFKFTTTAFKQNLAAV